VRGFSTATGWAGAAEGQVGVRICIVVHHLTPEFCHASYNPTIGVLMGALPFAEQREASA